MRTNGNKSLSKIIVSLENFASNVTSQSLLIFQNIFLWPEASGEGLSDCRRVRYKIFLFRNCFHSPHLSSHRLKCKSKRNLLNQSSFRNILSNKPANIFNPVISHQTTEKQSLYLMALDLDILESYFQHRVIFIEEFNIFHCFTFLWHVRLCVSVSILGSEIFHPNYLWNSLFMLLQIKWWEISLENGCVNKIYLTNV